MQVPLKLIIAQLVAVGPFRRRAHENFVIHERQALEGRNRSCPYDVPAVEMDVVCFHFECPAAGLILALIPYYNSFSYSSVNTDTYGENERA
jgi:hypothetical protein